MLTGRQIRVTFLGAISALLLLIVATSGAAAQDECTLTVEPASAPAGSDFTLAGSGFTPTELVLRKEGGQPVTIQLDLGTDDPFEIPIGSRPGDEGVWHATASEPGTCSATVSFEATLQNTDTIDDIVGATTGGRLPLVVYLAIVALGLVGGSRIARRVVA